MKQLKDSEMYVQCRIQKTEAEVVSSSVATSKTERVIWANSDKAVVGNTVKVEEDNGTWTTGWKVMDVYGSPLPESVIKHRSHDHKRQRAASDI